MTPENLSKGARDTLAAQARSGDGTPLEELSAPDARRAFDSGWPGLQLPPAGVATSITIANLPALVWRGKDTPATGARVVLYLHGGGWVIGSPQSHAAICERLAQACRAVVICPDYRLAPEHPFPAAAEDAIGCLVALPGLADILGFSADRIILAGDSAGGNLAAVAALAATHRPNVPTPRAQLLFYPNTNAHQSSPGYRRFAEGFGLTARTMQWFRDQYVAPDQYDDWRVSPLLADVRAAAPAFVGLAGADILHDEGQAYATHLAAAGVPVETRLWHGHLHGFLSACRYDPAAQEALRDAAAYLDRRGV